MTDLVILAAGLGKRFATMTGGGPKVMLRLPSGRSLLAENLTNALSTGVASRAVVVTGYRAELIDREVARHERAPSIATVHNPDYATFGPVHSLWAARDTLERGDVIILNGDTFYRPEALLELADRHAPGFHLLYSRRGVEHDDVKVTLEGDRVVAVGKHLPANEAHGVSAGVLLVRGPAARTRFSGVLARFVREGAVGERPVIWHDLVHEVARDGSVVAVEVGHRNWIEVDTLEDYEALCEALEVSATQRRDRGLGQ